MNGIVHGFTKSPTRLSDFHCHFQWVKPSAREERGRKDWGGRGSLWSSILQGASSFLPIVVHFVLGWEAVSTEEGNSYPLQYSGLENSMDCIFHGVTKSQTRLSNFHASLPWTSLSPRVCSDLCLLSWWCHDLWTITTWQIAPMWFHHLSIDHHLMRGKLNALCLFSRQLCMNTYITADCFFFFLTFTCQLCYLAIRDADFCAFHIFYSHWHHWVFVFVYTSIQHFFFTLVPRQIYFSSKTTSKTHNIDLIAT